MSDMAVTPTHDTPTMEPHPETAVPTTPPGAPLEGEAPRLASGPIAAPSPIGTGAPSLPNTPAPASPPTTPEATLPSADATNLVPTLPQNAPVLPTAAPVTRAATPQPHDAEERFAQKAVDLNGIDLPTLPTAPAAATPMIVEDTEEATTEEAPAADGEPEHPMAHLMPKKSKPTEASIRAAEQRAIKKAKAKKIKIGVAVGALVVSALAGPPFVSWLTNAIDESGSTSTETGE